MFIKHSKFLILANVLYIIIGIGVQIYSCRTNPDSDLPCLSIVFTPISVLSWPLFGVFEIFFFLMDGPMKVIYPDHTGYNVNLIRGLVIIVLFGVNLCVAFIPDVLHKKKT